LPEDGESIPNSHLARIVAETIHLVVYIEAGVSFRADASEEVCLVKGHDGERFEIEQL